MSRLPCRALCVTWERRLRPTLPGGGAFPKTRSPSRLRGSVSSVLPGPALHDPLASVHTQPYPAPIPRLPGTAYGDGATSVGTGCRRGLSVAAGPESPGEPLCALGSEVSVVPHSPSSAGDSKPRPIPASVPPMAGEAWAVGQPAPGGRRDPSHGSDHPPCPSCGQAPRRNGLPIFTRRRASFRCFSWMSSRSTPASRRSETSTRWTTRDLVG